LSKQLFNPQAVNCEPTLLKVFRFRFKGKALVIAAALAAAIFGALTPWFQKVFIDHLVSNQNIAQVSPFNHLAVAIGVFIAWQLCTFLARVAAAKESAHVIRLLSEDVYRKTLYLDPDVQSTKGVGEIVNLYATDVAAAAALVDEFLIQFVLAIFPLFIGPFIAWYWLNIPFFDVLGLTLLVVGVMLAFSLRQSRFFTAFKALAGERLAVVNEWLQNMRIIRILGWTEAFEERIKQKRILETANRIAMVTNGSTMNSIAQVAPFLVTVASTLLVVSHHQDQFTPGTIFTILWIFGVYMSRPIRMIPWNFVIFMDGFLSCKRLDRFLRLPVIEGGISFSPWESKMQVGPDLEIKNLNLTFGQRTILKDINLKIPFGNFVVIVGDVGAGKSQLLNALLLENQAQWDTYSLGNYALTSDSGSRHCIHSHMSYVSQDGFIVSANIGENLSLSYSLDDAEKDKMKKCLDWAQFNLDEEKLRDLSTEIGERGVNLSGGQRQRIGIARAAYHDRPIILMDDCVSAVDSKTEEQLIRELFCGAWKGKTRILVTHRLSVLKFAHQAFALKDGQLNPLPEADHG
jgi:ATP-binding cassette, subfamily B, multidrug efflux pump